MVDLFFATCRENTTTGYAALIIEDGNLSGKSAAKGEEDAKSKSIFQAVLGRVPAESEIKVHLLDGERLTSEVSADKLYKAMYRRGHPSVEIQLHGPTDGERPGDLNPQTILAGLDTKARAAAWGVRLNASSFVPGPSISTQKAQGLHKRASRNGFSEGALRLLLSEYGLISTGGVTSAIYDDLVNRLSSETVAKIYNERYQHGQYAQPEVQ